MAERANPSRLGGHFAHVEAAFAVDAPGAYKPLDARFGFRRRQYDLSLWGTNLLNDKYIIDQLGGGSNQNPYHAYDRVVGIDFSVSF